MIAFAISFPSGRFHATPWGKHVNEAVPEWPPSPWRILRALVATWKRKLETNAVCSFETLERPLKLLAEPPLFWLPKASTGHLRHYMPWFKKGPEDKTLIFDAFVALEKQAELIIFWPNVRLAALERNAFNQLAENLGFLGRAESWVEARVLSDEEAAEASKKINCSPVNGKTAEGGQESVRVLCVDSETAFSNEHTPPIDRSVKKRSDSRQSRIALYDPNWHLCMETLELHSKRWSDPPGSKWVTYLRPKNCFAFERRTRVYSRERPQPTVARFVLDSPVLPLVEVTLKVAELARRTFMGKYRRIEEWRLYNGATPEGIALPKSEVFSGKDVNGNFLRGHQHAYYLPTDEDEDGRIDHLTIIAIMGFGRSEVKALDEIRRLKRDDGEPLNLLLLALGRSEAILAKRLLGPSKTWISATPFIVTRHPKKNGRKKDLPELLGKQNQRTFARQVLIEEIDRLRELRGDIPDPLSVEPLNPEHHIGTHKLRPIQFKRFRQKRGDDGGRRPAGAFWIEFPSAIRGPLCLGHSSHFGLGLFMAPTNR